MPEADLPRLLAEAAAISPVESQKEHFALYSYMNLNPVQEPKWKKVFQPLFDAFLCFCLFPKDLNRAVSEFYTGTPDKLIPILNSKGLTTTVDNATGIIFAKGYYNLTDVVLAANNAGVNIARVVTKETDLETYFVNLVGGESHA